MNLREKNPPAVIRIGPPSVSLLLTVELVTAIIVWGSCAGWQGGGERQQEQQVEHGCVLFSGWLSLLLRRAGCLLSDVSVDSAGFISADKEKHYVCYSVERSRSI